MGAASQELPGAGVAMSHRAGCGRGGAEPGHRCCLVLQRFDGTQVSGRRVADGVGVHREQGGGVVRGEHAGRLAEAAQLGGVAPSPRKLRPAPVTIADPRSIVASTTMPGRTPGRIARRKTPIGVCPRAVAASTYSKVLTASASPRASRA